MIWVIWASRLGAGGHDVGGGFDNLSFLEAPLRATLVGELDGGGGKAWMEVRRAGGMQSKSKRLPAAPC